MQQVTVIDSHTAGEPTRVVVSGLPELGSGPLAERCQHFAEDHDHWRSALVCEPRSAEIVVGALLQTPVNPHCCAGVIFFNNVGYLGMCGHGMMGVVRTLAYLGRIASGRHWLETPVGVVGVELHQDGRVSIDNVESWRARAGVLVDVPEYGPVSGDIAWGGNWFFITGQTPLALELANAPQLTAYAKAIKRALDAAGISAEDDDIIDHIEISGQAPDGSGQARNFVLCPGGAYDRSPCGTGTSAKLACLAADGTLAAGEHWIQQGILGRHFEASYQPGARGILPRITGQAWLTGKAELLLEPDDPFAWGIG